MKRIVLIPILLLTLIAFVLAADYRQHQGNVRIDLDITDAADTARVVTITPSHAVDSFHYHCSLSHLPSMWQRLTRVRLPLRKNP